MTELRDLGEQPGARFETRAVARIEASEVAFEVAGEREVLRSPTRWPPHTHAVHELLWSEQGILGVQTAERSWVLPPHTAIWIPAHTVHAAQIGADGLFRAVYFSVAQGSPLGKQVTTADVTPLLQRLLDYVTQQELGEAQLSRALAVVMDVLQPSRDQVHLWVPTDPRCADMAQQILAHPGEPHDLEGWARLLGLSSRTVTRIFRAETGHGYRSWLIHVRVHRAAALLRDGVAVKDVAAEVGFQTASAFAQTFRRITGTTPGRYRARLAGVSDMKHDLSYNSS